MTYILSDSPESAMEMFWHHIAIAQQGGPNVDPSLRRALITLVELDNSLALAQPKSTEALRQFRQESIEVLMHFPKQIEAYPDIALFLAEGANDDEWYELCMRRSVIQILLDDYAGTPLAALINPQDVSNLDAELYRVGAEQGPVPEPFVPKGLPDSHWWWRYPAITNTPGLTQ